MSTTTILLISFSFLIACAAFALIAQLLLLADASRDDRRAEPRASLDSSERTAEETKAGGRSGRPLENGLTRPPV